MSEGAGAQGPRAPSAGAAWGLAGPPGRPGQVVKTSPSQASKQLPHSHRRSCRSPAKSCPRSLTSITDADTPCTLISSQDMGQACGCCVPLHVVRRTREKLGLLAQHPLLVLFQQGPCSCRRLVQHRQWGQAGGTRGRPSRPQLCWQCSSQPCREAQPCHPSDRVLLPHSTSLRTPWAPQLGPAAEVSAPCSPAGAAPGQSGILLREPRLQSAS